MAKILILQGPNLNLLGKRELNIYGDVTLAEIHSQLQHTAAQLEHTLECFQSNAEHQLIEAIHNTLDSNIELIIINPGAYTHTSIALRDALLGVAKPFIEVHLSNIDGRETFRRRSYLADIAIGRISGFGAYSYQLALQAAHNYLSLEENYGHS